MLEGAGEQVRDRRECDMGMRPHVNSLSRCELSRTQVIEENERANHLAPLCGQHSAYDKAAQIALPRIYTL